MNIRKCAIGLGSTIAMTVAGCVAADKAVPESTASAPKVLAPAASAATAPPPANSEPTTQPLTGWYLEGANGSRLQPCGQSEQWPIGDKADLEARAKTFGLGVDTPVYVKLLARVSGAGAAKTVDVVQVTQFGSPTPVRDCSMTGVVTPAPNP